MDTTRHPVLNRTPPTRFRRGVSDLYRFQLPNLPSRRDELQNLHSHPTPDIRLGHRASLSHYLSSGALRN